MKKENKTILGALMAMVIIVSLDAYCFIFEQMDNYQAFVLIITSAFALLLSIGVILVEIINGIDDRYNY